MILQQGLKYQNRYQPTHSVHGYFSAPSVNSAASSYLEEISILTGKRVAKPSESCSVDGVPQPFSLKISLRSSISSPLGDLQGRRRNVRTLPSTPSSVAIFWISW